MSAEEVAIWAAVLDMDRSELILQYGCGVKVITLDEAQRLTKEEGMEVFPDIIPHVA